MEPLQIIYVAVIALNIPLWIAVAYKFYKKRKQQEPEVELYAEGD